jgi:hypothetical protein
MLCVFREPLNMCNKFIDKFGSSDELKIQPTYPLMGMLTASFQNDTWIIKQIINCNDWEDERKHYWI